MVVYSCAREYIHHSTPNGKVKHIFSDTLNLRVGLRRYHGSDVEDPKALAKEE